METNKKKVYEPPTMEVTQVVLESVIAASPLKNVELKEWEPDPDDGPNNNSDIWLNL
jgi:hypothetical protein